MITMGELTNFNDLSAEAQLDWLLDNAQRAEEMLRALRNHHRNIEVKGYMRAFIEAGSADDIEQVKRAAEESGMKTRLMVEVEHDDIRTLGRVMGALGDDMPHDYKERGITMAPELRFTTTLREDEIARQLAEARAEIAE